MCALLLMWLSFSRSLMYSEANRRETFTSWPHAGYRWAQPDPMAQAGFYHQVGSSLSVCSLAVFCLFFFLSSGILLFVSCFLTCTFCLRFFPFFSFCFSCIKSLCLCVIFRHSVKSHFWFCFVGGIPQIHSGTRGHSPWPYH